MTRGALFYALEDGLTLSGPSPPSPFERYSIAKAANVLFAVELQRRIDEAGPTHIIGMAPLLCKISGCRL